MNAHTIQTTQDVITAYKDYHFQIAPAQQPDSSQRLAYWKEALAGHRAPVVEDMPMPGLYRDNNGDAFEFAWAVKTLARKVWVIVHKNNERILQGDLIKTWSFCAKHPVSREAFEFKIKHGHWPEQAEQKASEEDGEDISAALADMVKSFEANLTIVKTQVEADTGAGYVQHARAAMKEAKEVSDAAKAPLKAELDKVAEKYDSQIRRLDSLVKEQCAQILPFALEQVRQSNDPKYKFAAGRGGISKALGLKATDAVSVTDEQAMVDHFLSSPEVRSAMVAAATKLATKALKDGEAVPGAELIKKHSIV